jgi:hypothetical protein
LFPGFPPRSAATNGPPAAELTAVFTPFAPDFHARIQVPSHEFLTSYYDGASRVSVTDGRDGVWGEIGPRPREGKGIRELLFHLIGEAGIGCPRAASPSLRGPVVRVLVLLVFALGPSSRRDPIPLVCCGWWCPSSSAAPSCPRATWRIRSVDSGGGFPFTARPYPIAYAFRRPSLASRGDGHQFVHASLVILLGHPVVYVSSSWIMMSISCGDQIG